MKKIITCLFVLAFSLTALAQDKAALQTGLNRYYKNTTEGHYEALLDDTYPKIFEIIPRDQMLKSLQAMLNGPGYILDVLEAPANFSVGDIKQLGSGYYCVVKHDLLMKMTFTEPVGNDESKAMIENLKTSMKAHEVTFNPRSNSFTIMVKADIIAIANTATGNKWKFMNRGGEKLMEKVLTADERKALGV